MWLQSVNVLVIFFSFVKGAPSTDDGLTVPTLRQGDKIYHIAPNYKMTFLQALRYCQNLNMSLLSIESEKENKEIYKLIRDADVGKEFWSSATRIIDGKSWLWLSNGESVEYTNWDDNQPDDQQCIDLRIDDRDKLYWHDENCNARRPLICEKDSEDNKDIWAKIISSYPSLDIVKVENKALYFFRHYKGTFWNGVQVCDFLGMKPVSVETKEENEKIYKYIRDTNGDSLWWTSGTRILDDATWYWLSTGQKIEYTNWYPYEPNNKAGNERCLQLQLDKDKDNLFFNDDNCDVELPFICQLKTDRIHKRDLEFTRAKKINLEEENLEEECKQPVISVYINNNAKVRVEEELLPIRVEAPGGTEHNLYSVHNKWNSCKH